jgi:hypothetical protein
MFVFFIGLEGTGHHLMKELLIHSPSLGTLDELGLNQTHKQLTRSLFNRKHPEVAVLNSHCSYNHDVNVTALQQATVRLLRQIHNQSKHLSSSLTIPLNCVNGGFYSYPAGARQCLNYPNIDVLYDTCRKAGVNCKHVLLYRNPFSILHSTTVKRQFNSNILKGIHLYTSMMNIIYAQLLAHADKTLGCLGLLESNVTISGNETRMILQHLLGWTNDTVPEFNDFVDTIYQQPEILSLDERQEMVPPTLQVYMDSFIRAHESVVQLCKEQMRQR